MKPLETIKPIDLSPVQQVEQSTPFQGEPKVIAQKDVPETIHTDAEKADRDRPSEKEMVKRMVDRLNHMNRVLDRKIQFEVADETEDVIVRIVDRETGHTIRQIPPPELVKLSTRMEEIYEIIFNLKL